MSTAELLQSPQKLSSAQLRKIKKPMIEKRRRERINDSLNQLKALVLEALNKDENQYNKMEKADILEMTVKHLRSLHRQVAIHTQTSQAPPTSHTHAAHKTVAPSYTSGYSECAEEVRRYLGSSNIVNHDVKSQLTSHLSARVSSYGSVESRDGGAAVRECRSLSPVSPASSPVSMAHSPSSRDSFTASPVSDTSAQSSPVMCSNSMSQFPYSAVSNSQPMLLAAGSVSPMLSTQGFVPIVISPVAAAAAASQTQMTSQSNVMTSPQLHATQLHVTSQTQMTSPTTSPMAGTVIPLYHATSPSQTNSVDTRSTLHRPNVRHAVSTKHGNVLHLRDITQNQDTYHQNVCYFSSEQKMAESESVWRPW